MPIQNGSSPTSDIHTARHHIRQLICKILQRKKLQTPLDQSKIFSIATRVEEVLYKNAATKEEYTNINTLEQRLQSLLKRSASNRSQQPHFVSSSSSFGTMIPTPGMSHPRNLNPPDTSSADNSTVPVPISGNGAGATDIVSERSMLPTSSGPNGPVYGSSFGSSIGTFSNGYQQSPTNITISSSGNNIIPLTGLRRTASQMIPTPRLDTNVNLDSYNTSGLLPGSTISPQPQPLKQYGGNHNGHILHNINDQMGTGIRSGFQQKSVSYNFLNGSKNDGLGSSGDNIQLMHNLRTSEGLLRATSSGYPSPSSWPSASHFVPQGALSQQMNTIPGDGYGMNTTDLSGQEKLYCTKTTFETALNDQNLNKTAPTKLQSTDQTSRLNFQSCHLSQQQTPKFPQQELQQQAHLLPQHAKHQQNQPSLLSTNDEHMQSQVTASLDSQVQHVQGMNSHGDAQYSKVPVQFQRPEIHNQFQQIVVGENCSEGAHMLWEPSGPEEPCSSFSQSPLQQTTNNPHQLVESQNNSGSNINGAQSEALLNGHWHSQSQEKFQSQSSREYHVEEEFRQRVRGNDEAQRPQSSSNGSLTSETSVSRLNITSRTHNAATLGQRNAAPINWNEIRWLLFLKHASRCLSAEGKCLEVNCIKAQQLLNHIKGCNSGECSYPRCRASSKLLVHHRTCRRQTCPICIPVRNYIQAHKISKKNYTVSRIKSPARHPLDSGFVNPVYESCKSTDTKGTGLEVGDRMQTSEVSESQQSIVKRVKLEHPSPSPILNNDSSLASVPATSQLHASQHTHSELHQQCDIPRKVEHENIDVKKGSFVSSERDSPLFDEKEPMYRKGPDALVKQESMEIEKDVDAIKEEIHQEMAAVSTEQSSITKTEKPKIKGVSLTELFTPDEIRRHIIGLRQWVGQSKAKAERNQAMEHSMSENSCQLCAVEKLSFEPPPMYCTPCGVRIKRSAMYYNIGSGETRQYLCIPCYNEHRGETIVIDGSTILKTTIEKKKNDEEAEEWWVQCDKCEAWQHQICALFNGRRNDGGQAEYTCPNCYIGEIERGDRNPLPQSAVLGAKDLPRTILSNHIEERLFRRLRQEKEDRARVEGKNVDEVPGADALVVRVVSSVDKKLDVKPRFLEIFQEDNYPTEFPYKSKVILLFQKIEGVEVCLFGMYVQEFGSESLLPNQRRVYLSYLDSVKYFRPDIKAVTGEALRTFVYHEILIAYLEYCKKRGFTSCYIWACPPLKGEDYILYCHPEIQKTPKSDKLREWYLSMLRKASKENIVVELTNLYDHFFVSTGECKAKVTAARLPYFDGDYWPGAAEDIINQLCQEEDSSNQHRKGKTKKIITKRVSKAAGQTDLCTIASKDILLMQKLGETISPMKEDFIMVHLQNACTHCCHVMASGTRWVCTQCKNFQLCDKCYETEEKLEERERHPIYSMDTHRLDPVEVNDVPEDTKDMDDIVESEFFDTRQAFLSLCQGNHYQYDTLRRAKHSSMMVLYHLHNPTAPAFVTSCNICHKDIETGQGWHCETCTEYDICNSCYHKDGRVAHPHNITRHVSVAERDAQNKDARELRVLQLRKMLDLLVHAAQCKYLVCPYLNCRKVKSLFRHGIYCKIRAPGGCTMCRRMWYTLQLHARNCKEPLCPVPRCRDLKEHIRRSQQQDDSRRRVAVMEMMRQRAAEVAVESGC